MSMMSKEPVFPLIGGISTFGKGSATSAAITGRVIASSAAPHASADKKDFARRERGPRGATARTVPIGTPLLDDPMADHEVSAPSRSRGRAGAPAAGTGDRFRVGELHLVA